MDLTLDFLLPPPPPRLPGTTPRLGCVVRPRPRHDFSDLWSSNHTLVPRHPQAARSPWKQIGQLLLLGKQPLGLIRDLEAVMPKSRCYCGCHMRNRPVKNIGAAKAGTADGSKRLGLGQEAICSQPERHGGADASSRSSGNGSGLPAGCWGCGARQKQQKMQRGCRGEKGGRCGHQGLEKLHGVLQAVPLPQSRRRSGSRCGLKQLPWSCQ
ncbi:uncharacterized protein LOC123387752 isoform X4 [Mustela putorius furo]|uniref:Uncharacterized protein LOC123387752 isoform X4 n=1 Tax=Mustela putorius furo TaxID=9669 RepID=A0A8U0RDF8_MUSPF|nr:uncharacterized protein LOC123387752 isoform X4 [Mustela putorius furo]